MPEVADSVVMKFQKNLIVWKPHGGGETFSRIGEVSEELNSVETAELSFACVSYVRGFRRT